MEEKLKPCPFCGKNDLSEDDILQKDYSNTAYFGVYVACDCGASGKIYDADSEYTYKVAKKNAIKFWNKRVNQ